MPTQVGKNGPGISFPRLGRAFHKRSIDRLAALGSVRIEQRKGLHRTGVCLENLWQPLERPRSDRPQGAVDDVQCLRLRPLRRGSVVQRREALHLAGRKGKAVAHQHQRHPAFRRQCRRRGIVGDDEIGVDRGEQAFPRHQQHAQRPLVGEAEPSEHVAEGGGRDGGALPFIGKRQRPSGSRKDFHAVRDQHLGRLRLLDDSDPGAGHARRAARPAGAAV